MTFPRPETELFVLQTIRLAGVADTRALTERLKGSDLDPEDPRVDLLDVLEHLVETHRVERMSFADFGGWILSEAGQTHVAELLSAEAGASARTRRLLECTADGFDEVNAEFVNVISAWQLYPAVDPPAAAGPEELLHFLGRTAQTLSRLLSPLAEELPRFARYPRQFLAAVEHADGGNLDWVSGVGVLSCHTVWAELHQDLLSTLGRQRSPQTSQEGP